ncbi:hypothetical protein [Pseudoduganella violaceinigra]|uniref:hypothetical protein n=1 Tax=Pseudoduganella violaceinigra TaxID=246602 RepID=UPI000401DC2A|nr:hypothetical protein [Pseudoduganella violaceinigra]
MGHLLAIELGGLLLLLACLPCWLAGKWYAAHGAPPALGRSFAINLVLLLVGTGLTVAAIALEMREFKPMLTWAFGLLGILGLLVSAALHAFDEL